MAASKVQFQNLEGSMALSPAAQWLQAELREERASMNRDIEARHREIIMQLELFLRESSLQVPRAAEANSADGANGGNGAEAPAVVLKAEFAGAIAPDAAEANGGSTAEPDESPERHSSKRSVSTAGSSGGSGGGASKASVAQPGRLARLVNSAQFEICFGVLIMCNAAVMAVNIQYEGLQSAYLLDYKDSRPAQEAWAGADKAFMLLEWFFGCLFALEVLVKIVALRQKFWTDTWWNGFDFVVVAIWAIDRLTMLLTLDPTILRMARLARLVRLLRVMRWLQIVDPLILMVKAIKASVSVLIWSLLLLVLVISVIAMAISVILESWIRDDAIDHAQRVAVFLSWGSYTRAMETMFEITIGNFGPPTRELMNSVDEWWGTLILAYKLTIGFAVVQVITSVFIQQTFKVASRDEEVMIKEKAAAAEAYTKHLSNLFKYMDESGDGAISREEFEVMVHDKRAKTWFAALEVDASEVSQLFDLLDDGDGEITQDEFINGVKSLKGGAKGTDMMLLLRDAKKNSKSLTSIQETVEYLASSAMVAAPQRPSRLNRAVTSESLVMQI